MDYFYDGQMRRYLTQFIRVMSNFSYKDGKGNLVQVPVRYGDMTRQVASILQQNSENIMNTVPDHVHFSKSCEESKNIMERFEFFVILRIFKRLTLLESCSNEYKIESDKYNKYNKMYTYDNNIAVNIHKFNNNLEKCYTQSELILKALTPYRMNQELLSYELLHYRPDNFNKIIFFNDNMDSISHNIRDEINRFNPIIQSYIEDKCWTVNFNDTLNFGVPKNKIIISNTISTYDIDNHIINEHMDMLLSYLKHIFKVSSMKYAIVEDNKYDLSWILISIGYYNKKSI